MAISRTNKLCLLLLSGVGLLMTGCTDLTAKVTGTVYLDDKPVNITSSQRGMVVFRPTKGGATCTGLIGESGNYSVSTGSESALVPGDYLVSVQVLESVPPKGGDDAPSGKPITPALYADPLTSGLSFVVKGGANEYDIKLDSSAGPTVIAPPEPEVDEPEVDELEVEPAVDGPAVDGPESKPTPPDETEPTAKPTEEDQPESANSAESEGDSSEP